MFCPRCGLKNSIEQKFCRSCGMNLEQSAAAVLDQLPGRHCEGLERQEKMLERFGAVAFTGFGIVVGIGVLGILYAILTSMILSGTRPLPGILLIAFVVFAVLSLSYVVWRESLNEKRIKIVKAPVLTELSASDSRFIADKPLEQMMSVVEETTERLSRHKTKELR